MGLRRGFLPLVLRRGFHCLLVNSHFYICICRRNAKGWNVNIEFSLLAFVIDFGVVTRFLICSLAHIYIIPTFCSLCDNYQYNLPQYLFHAIRDSPDVILHFHHLGCFNTVFIHTAMHWENKLVFRIARKKYAKVSKQRNYDIKQHSDATWD